MKKSSELSDNMTIEEASEFWDNHSVADYPSHIVQMDYMQGEKIILVAIANDLLDIVSHKAKERGISIETLVNLWIQEKIAMLEH